MDRRRMLTLSATATAGLVLGACGGGDGRSTGSPSPSPPSPSPSAAGSSAPANASVLVAYFSRAGENYYYGDRVWLETGNTEVVVQMIADTIDCDLHRIEAAQPYPRQYEPTVARNSQEQDDDARPEMASDLPALDSYDVVILASPIWGSRAPMIMSTFTEALDFTGKTVHPFTTHAMSGLGSTERDYAETCRGAEFGEGLAVQGETVRDARPEIEDWLKKTRLMS